MPNSFEVTLDAQASGGIDAGGVRKADKGQKPGKKKKPAKDRVSAQANGAVRWMRKVVVERLPDGTNGAAKPVAVAVLFIDSTQWDASIDVQDIPIWKGIVAHGGLAAASDKHLEHAVVFLLDQSAEGYASLYGTVTTVPTEGELRAMKSDPTFLQHIQSWRKTSRDNGSQGGHGGIGYKGKGKNGAKVTIDYARSNESIHEEDVSYDDGELRGKIRSGGEQTDGVTLDVSQKQLDKGKSKLGLVDPLMSASETEAYVVEGQAENGELVDGAIDKTKTNREQALFGLLERKTELRQKVLLRDADLDVLRHRASSDLSAFVDCAVSKSLWAPMRSLAHALTSPRLEADEAAVDPETARVLSNLRAIGSFLDEHEIPGRRSLEHVLRDFKQNGK